MNSPAHPSVTPSAMLSKTVESPNGGMGYRDEYEQVLPGNGDELVQKLQNGSKICSETSSSYMTPTCTRCPQMESALPFTQMTIG